MPRVSEAHLAARREQILAAARELFAARGFARTSMDDVVRASGLSMGSVYRYFPSKSDLVIAVCEGHGGEVDGGFPAETPAELVARLAGYVAPGGSHARMAIQVWGEAAIVPQLAGTVTATHQRLQDHLAGLLHCPDPASRDAVAQTALAALIGLAALVAAGVEVDHERVVAVLAGLLDTRAEG